MVKSISIILVLLLIQNLALKAQDQILGNFWSPKKDGKIEIYKRDNKYFGKLTWLQNPRNDIENPDEALRKKPVLGMEFLKNFIFKGNNIWEDGTIYDAKTGKTYDCIMSVNDENNLKVRGYIGFSLIGRTEVFERIKE